MSLRLRFVSHSEIGPVRKNNQDSGYASERLLVVADGMGGAAAGDLASAVAIDTLKGLDSERLTEADTGTQLDRLATGIRRANDRIADLIAADYHLEGMGTTVTGALFDGDQLSLVHIGDSRAYLLRDGRLERITHDHSWVQSLVDDGKITEAEAAVHPHRSLLLKVLNGQPANEPDLTNVPLRAGDRLLFCSDGVCGLVDDPDIEAALRRPSLEEALETLVDAALAAGGIDNITAILADAVEEAEDADAAGATPTTASAGAPAGTPGGSATAGSAAAIGAGAAAVVLGAAAERQIPAVREGLARSNAEADQDTLTRGRAVPASASGAGSVGGAGATAAGGSPIESSSPEPEDEARYNPQPPRRGRFVRVLAAVTVLVLVLGTSLGVGYAWTRNQYFVGAAGDRVAIYQGLPESLPGIELSSVFEIQPLQLSTLPQYYRDMITAGIEVESLDAARQTVAQLTETAKRCASPTPRPPSTPPSTSPSRPPSAPPSGTPSGPASGGPPASSPTVIGPSVPSTPIPSTSAPVTAAPNTPAPSTPAPSTPAPSTPAGTPPASTPASPSPSGSPSVAPRPDC